MLRLFGVESGAPAAVGEGTASRITGEAVANLPSRDEICAARLTPRALSEEARDLSGHAGMRRRNARPKCLRLGKIQLTPRALQF
eukprot:1959499-Pyramimonas_sp.AAC.1